MSNRTSTEKVKEIMDTDIEDMTAFIKAANLIVSEKLVGQGLSADYLEEIERWLAAHLACARDPREKSSKTGDASATYTGNFGEGLKSTPYGQQVLLLDSTGIMAKIGKKKATFVSIDFDVGE